MRLRHFRIFILFSAILCISCKQTNTVSNPWGDIPDSDEPQSSASSAMQLDDIIRNGELIMVTISGPDTYYEYHGKGMGLHYLLCEKFAQSIGVSLRVDVCKDTLEMIERVKKGEADIIAMPMKKGNNTLLPCAEKASNNKWHWLVNPENTSLADTLNNYLTSAMVKKVGEEEEFWLSARSITRRVYSPMQNRAKGIISNYDHLFQRYAAVARWDWRLLAAQCYQESTFDPQAHSWAGACGLMQIMPGTADELGLTRSAIYEPEQNVAAATKYIAQLTQRFSDVQNPTERIKFVLASYNGGAHHVRDAMALARKHGGSEYRWSDVRTYILRLMQPQYYNDPVVKYGYMRGTETAGYVDRIWDRWLYYRGVKTSLSPAPSLSPEANTPQPRRSAKRKEKYNI